MSTETSFNSLQTGKHIQRPCGTNSARTIFTSFNSLQTGKHIQSGLWSQKICLLPSFNSLQTGKHIQSRTPVFGDTPVDFKFQFPSNGKAYTKDLIGAIECGEIKVSIPFKRESIYKALSRLQPRGWGKRFQFPSNGKAYTKLYLVADDNDGSGGFNSLQTGKHIQSGWCRFSPKNR